MYANYPQIQSKKKKKREINLQGAVQTPKVLVILYQRNNRKKQSRQELRVLNTVPATAARP